jgi:DNA-binding XRE family transcriptional regulator
MEKQRRRTARKGGGEGLFPEKKGRKSRSRLKLPKWDENTGIANLDPDEVAFIAEERAERLERGWSQEELASRAEVSRGCVRHLEERRSGPTLRVAVRIVRAFGKELDTFLDAGRHRIHAGLTGLFPLEMLSCL